MLIIIKMYKYILFFIVTLTFAINVDAQTIELRKAYMSLIAVEKAFAETSKLIGSRDAFLIFFDEDGIVFNPEPVNIIDVYKDRPQTESSLLWRPMFADISQSGDFGYTTGPWEYRQNKMSENPDAFGQYLTVWKRGEFDLWKAVIDGGISYSKPDSSLIEEFNINHESKIIEGSIESDKEHFTNSIIAQDKIFSLKSSQAGFASAFKKYADPDVRVYRENNLLTKGIGDSIGILTNDNMNWLPDGGDVSLMGDMGYTYGTGKITLTQSDEEEKHFSYFRIWKSIGNNNWKIVADLVLIH